MGRRKKYVKVEIKILEQELITLHWFKELPTNLVRSNLLDRYITFLEKLLA